MTERKRQLRYSQAFDAGNYCNAYETQDYETATKSMFPKRGISGIESIACFTIAFFSAYEESEVPSNDLEVYQAAHGIMGSYCRKQGWID